MKVETRGELQQLLRHYNKPILDDISKIPYERRHFMEFIRPTLRYYCKKLNVEIPSWLQGDEHYGFGKGSPEEMEEQFGKPKIEPAKWDEFMFEDLEKKKPKSQASPQKKAGSQKPGNKVPSRGKPSGKGKR